MYNVSTSVGAQLKNLDCFNVMKHFFKGARVTSFIILAVHVARQFSYIFWSTFSLRSFEMKLLFWASLLRDTTRGTADTIQLWQTDETLATQVCLRLLRQLRVTLRTKILGAEDGATIVLYQLRLYEDDDDYMQWDASSDNDPP